MERLESEKRRGSKCRAPLVSICEHLFLVSLGPYAKIKYLNSSELDSCHVHRIYGKFKSNNTKQMREEEGGLVVIVKS